MITFYFSTCRLCSFGDATVLLLFQHLPSRSQQASSADVSGCVHLSLDSTRTRGPQGTAAPPPVPTRLIFRCLPLRFRRFYYTVLGCAFLVDSACGRGWPQNLCAKLSKPRCGRHPSQDPERVEGQHAVRASSPGRHLRAANPGEGTGPEQVDGHASQKLGLRPGLPTTWFVSGCVFTGVT